MTWEIQRTKQGLQRAAKQHSNPQAAEFLRSYDTNLHTDPESAIRGANALLQSLSVDTADVADKRASFFPSLLRLLFDRLEHGEEVSLCARIVDLLTGLLTQLSTRRYLIVLVEDWHVAARIRLSSLCRDVLLRAVERLEYFIGFEMDEISGRALEDAEAVEQFYHRIMVFQNVVFKYFPSKLEELCLTSVQRLTSREFLLAQLDLLSEEELRALAFISACPACREGGGADSVLESPASRDLRAGIAESPGSSAADQQSSSAARRGDSVEQGLGLGVSRRESV